MKVAALATLALAAVAQAHSIAQRIRVNGRDYGQCVGIRCPSSNNPIESVSHGDFACNVGAGSTGTVVDVPAGARVELWWGHVIGGAQYPNDADHPIAGSHKGPLQYYMAKVGSASSTGSHGLKWFKVGGEGYWGVTNMIKAGGWHGFTMPQCVAPGNYLLRAEIIALHNAYNYGGAQFYSSCAQINVQGGGNRQGDLVDFPGAYDGNHPGIKLNIYPDPPNYQIPGPAPLTC